MADKKQMQRKKTTRRPVRSTALATVDPSKVIELPNGTKLAKGVSGFLRTFTPEIGDKIVESVAQGMPLGFAAHLHKVPKSTVERWVAEGEDDHDHELSEFAAEVRAAQAMFVQEAIEGIKDAGLSDAKQWTALMTLLERIYPEYFRRPSEQKTTNINIAVGVVERQLHEMHLNGEIVYEGG